MLGAPEAGPRLADVRDRFGTFSHANQMHAPLASAVMAKAQPRGASLR